MASVLNFYKSSLIGHRYDYLPYLYYFDVEDFPSLKCDKFTFKSKEGIDLIGFKYYYKENNGKTIIFTHGIGAGHKAYTKEIDSFCKMGYIVYTFDITGCGESKGENINSFLQSLSDLNSFIEYYKKNISKDKVILIGHSWGGFASLNALLYQEDIIDKVVSISGFIQLKYIMKQNLGLLFPFVYKQIYEYEKNLNEEYLDKDILSYLKDTKKKILFIHSKDDRSVKYKYSIKIIQKINNDNLSFYIVDKRDHVPQYSDEGAAYYKQVFSKYKKKSKKMSSNDKKTYFKEINWEKTTKHDKMLFKYIENFINF